MSKLLKKICAVCTAVLLLACMFMFSANAAASTSIAFSTNSPKVGDNVTITVKLNAGEAIYSLEGTVTYDTSILEYVSGNGVKSGSSLKIVESLSGETSVSYNLVFKVLKAGSATISFSSVQYVGGNLQKISASGSSAKLNVKTAATSSTPQNSSKPQSSSKPQTPTVKSNNANLASLDIGGAALDPLFSGNTHSYAVTVENSVASVNINAKPAHSKATVSGAGEQALEVGDNEFKIVVTAQDGTKKTYSLKIRRATIEETIQLNPLTVIINGEMHHINDDLSGAAIPAGFTLGKATYNGKEIDVFKSDKGDYTLYSITKSASGSGITDYYVYKEHRDEFTPLNYMTVNNELYIFAELPETYTVPKGYYETATTLGNGTVKAFCSQNEALEGFYVIYCYADGEEGFFRFDSLKTTIQRAPEFTLTPAAGDTTGGKSFNPIEIFKGFNMTEKIMCCSLLGAFVIILVLIIALAVKSRKLKKAKYSDPISDEDMEGFFNIANFTPKHAMTEEDKPVSEEETAE